MLVPQPALVAMAAKYEALIALRTARDADGTASLSSDTKLELRRLSRAYPGCLRELDRCTLVVLQQRLADVQSPAATQQPAPWIAWMWRYHQLLGLALSVKRGNTLQLPELHAFEASCHAPPTGQIVPVVFEQLARETHTPVPVLQQTLFPPRGV